MSATPIEPGDVDRASCRPVHSATSFSPRSISGKSSARGNFWELSTKKSFPEFGSIRSAAPSSESAGDRSSNSIGPKSSMSAILIFVAEGSGAVDKVRFLILQVRSSKVTGPSILAVASRALPSVSSSVLDSASPSSCSARSWSSELVPFSLVPS